jgi:hypothetical protein
MSALGELIIYVIYFILGLLSVVFLILTIKSKNSIKPWTLIACILFGFLLYCFKSFQNDKYRKNQLSVVGVYYLTNYPDCDSCYIEIKENMTYIVVNKGKIAEQSIWHYEVGGDYWITYLDNDRHQLGYREYSYEFYRLKYPNIWNK